MSEHSTTPFRRPALALLTPARVYAVTRIGLGAWLFIDPSGFGAKWFTAPQDPLLTGALIRSIGARDAGIGLGLLLADQPRRWLILAAFCDVVDAGMVFLARGKFTQSQTVSGITGALAYGAIAVAISAFSRRRQPQLRAA